MKEEERKKAEEQQQQGKGKAKEEANPKPPSAPSSVKGTSTPTKIKPADPLRKGILKRPGSPNLSEASGSESSRKKIKKKHGADATSGDAVAKPVNQHLARAAGSGSDGETSDVGRKKLKIRLGGSAANSRPNSPNGSRAASPAPSRPGKSHSTPLLKKVLLKNVSATMGNISRASVNHFLSSGASSATLPELPSKEEIRSKLDPNGNTIAELTKKFPAGMLKHPEFINLIKANSRYDKESKKLFPKSSD